MNKSAGEISHAKKSASQTYISHQDKVLGIGQQKETEYRFSKFNIKSIHLEHNRLISQYTDCDHSHKQTAKMYREENEQIFGNVAECGTQDSLSNLVRPSSLIYPKTTQENVNNQPSYQESQHQITTHIENCNQIQMIMKGSFTSCRTNNASTSTYINMIHDRSVPRIKTRSNTFSTNLETEYYATTENSSKNKLEGDLKWLLLQDYYKCRQERNHVYTNSSSLKDIPGAFDDLYCNEAKHQAKELKRLGSSVVQKLTQIYPIYNKSSSHLVRIWEKQIDTQTESTNVQNTDSIKRFDIYTDMQKQPIQDTRDDLEAPIILTETRLRATDSPKRLDTYTDMQGIPIQYTRERRLRQDMAPRTHAIYAEWPSVRKQPHIRTDTILRTTDSAKRFDTYSDIYKQPFQRSRSKKLHPVIAPELIQEYTERSYVLREPYTPTETTETIKRSDMQKRSLQERRKYVISSDMALELTDTYAKRPLTSIEPYTLTDKRLRDTTTRFDICSNIQKLLFQDMRKKGLYPDVTPETLGTYIKRSSVPKEPHLPAELRLRVADSIKPYATYPGMKKRPFQDTCEIILHPDVAPELNVTFTRRASVPYKTAETRLRAADSTKRFNTISDEKQQLFHDTPGKRLYINTEVAPQPKDTIPKRPYVPKEPYIITDTKLRAADSTKRFDTISDEEQQQNQDTYGRTLYTDAVAALQPNDTITKRPYIPKEPHTITETTLRTTDSTKRFDTISGMKKQPVRDSCERRLHTNISPEIQISQAFWRTCRYTYAKSPKKTRIPYISSDTRLPAGISTKIFDAYTRREKILQPDEAPVIIDTYAQRSSVQKESSILTKSRLQAVDFTKRLNTKDLQTQPVHVTRKRILQPDIEPEIIDIYAKRTYVPIEPFRPTETRLRTGDSTKCFVIYPDMQRQPIHDVLDKALHPDMTPEMIDTYAESPDVSKEPYIPAAPRLRDVDSTKPFDTYPDVQRLRVQETRERRLLHPDMAPLIIDTYAKKCNVPKESYILAETKSRAADLTTCFDIYRDMQRQPIHDARDKALHADIASELVDNCAERSDVLKEPYIPAETRLRDAYSKKSFNTITGIQRQPIQACDTRLRSDMAPKITDTYTQMKSVPKEPYISAETRLRATDPTKRLDTITDMQRQPIQDTREKRLKQDAGTVERYAKRPSILKEPYIPVRTRLRFDTVTGIQRQPIRNTREKKIEQDVAALTDTSAKSPSVPKEPYIPAEIILRAADSTKRLETVPVMQKQPIQGIHEKRFFPDVAAPKLINKYAKKPTFLKASYKPAETQLRAADRTKGLDTIVLQKQLIQDTRENVLHSYVAPIIDTCTQKPTVLEDVCQKSYASAHSRVHKGESTTLSDMQNQPIKDETLERLHSEVAVKELIDTQTERPHAPKESYISTETRLRTADATKSFDTCLDMQKPPIQDTPEERLHPYVAPIINTYTAKPIVQKKPCISTDSRLRTGESARFDAVSDMQKQPIQDPPEERYYPDVAMPEIIDTHPGKSIVQEEPYIFTKSRLCTGTSAIRFDEISDMQERPFPDRRQNTFYPNVAPELVDTFTDRPDFPGEPYTPTDIRLRAADSRKRFDTFYDMHKQPNHDIRKERLHQNMAPGLGNKCTKSNLFLEDPYISADSRRPWESLIRFDTISDVQRRRFPDRHEDRFYSYVVPELEDTYSGRPNILKEPYIPTYTRLRASDLTKRFCTFSGMQKRPCQYRREKKLYSDVAPRVTDTYTIRSYAPKQPHTAIDSGLRAGDSSIRLDTEQESYFLYSDVQQTSGLSPMQRVFIRQKSTDKQSEQRSKIQATQYFDNSNIGAQEMTNLDDIQQLILTKDHTYIVVKGGPLLLSNEDAGLKMQNKSTTGPEVIDTFAPPYHKSRLKHKCDKNSQCTSRTLSVFKLRSARVPKIESKSNQTKSDHTPRSVACALASKRVNKTDTTCEYKQTPKIETRSKLPKTNITSCRRHHKCCTKRCQCNFMQKKMALRSDIDNEYQLRIVQYQPEQANKSVLTEATPEKREPRTDNKTEAIDHRRRQQMWKHYSSCEQVPTCLINNYMDLVNYCVHVPVCARVSLCWSTKPKSELTESNGTSVVKRVIPPPCMAVQTCDQRMWISDGKQSKEPNVQLQPLYCSTYSIICAPTSYGNNFSQSLFSKMPFFRSLISKSSAGSASSSGKNKFLKIFSRHKSS